MTTGPQYLASLTALRRIVVARVNNFHAEYMLSYVTRVLIGDFVVVNLMVFMAEPWEKWLIFPLLFTSQTIYRTPHFLPKTTEKQDLFESHSWPREGFNFFRGRTLHLWQLQLSRVTTMVQFYTLGVYYQWRTRGRGPGSAFLETPPPPHPYPPYLKVWIQHW